MGNIFTKKTNNDSCYITEISNINEDELDSSNIDQLQIKVLKEIIKDVKEVKDKKSDKIFYRFPVQICNYSLI